MRYLLLLLGLCSFIFLSAQNSFVQNNQFVVLNYEGDTLLNPWTGGFNAVQFSEIDLNLDGVKDLFVFDRAGNRISTFINSGVANQVSYSYAPEYIELFPDDIKDWALLRDYNCDGKMDIFTSATGDVKVYRNSSVGQLEFEVATEQITFDTQPDSLAPNFISLYIKSMDVPAIEDVDGDGDLDILRSSIIGDRIEYIKNLSVENHGVCDSLTYQIRNKCWGFVKEFTGQNQVILSDSCAPNVGNPEKTGSENKHVGGTALFMLDVDSNETKDLVMGGYGFRNLLLLVNSDPSLDFTSSHITSQSSNFPANNMNSIPVKLDHFIAGYYLDVNNDGVKDMLTSTNAMDNAANSNNVWAFLNSSADDHPDFNHLTNGFLQEGMIETGTGSHPSFVDYNADGKMDMIVGNFGLFDPNATNLYVSSLWLYENIGTASVPSFQLVDSNFADIANLNLDIASNSVTYVLAPSFGDLDGDGDEDMMLGDFLGNLHYFENTAGAGNVMNLVLSQAQYAGIDVGKNASPQLVDLNRDSLLDLVIGRQDGYISYYENQGTSSVPSFAWVTDSLGYVKTKAEFDFSGYSSPIVYEVAGSYKILSGAENGRVYQFGNIDGNLSGTFSVDTAYQGMDEGGKSTIAMADLNNDNLWDLVVGNIAGGVTLFMGDSNFVSIDEPAVEVTGIKIYPNPAAQEINIDLGDNKIAGAEIYVFDVLGKVMFSRTVTQQRIKIDITHFPSGMYFVSYSNGQNRTVTKVVKD